MKAVFSTLSATIALSIFFILSNTLPAYAGCIKVTCYCGAQVDCGSSNEDCIRACGDAVPPPSSPPPTTTSPPPSYDRQNQQRQQELRLQREADEIRQREEAKRREEERRIQFEKDKKSALGLLKSGSKPLGLKGTSGTGIKLKGTSGGDTEIKTGGYKGPVPVGPSSSSTDILSPETEVLKEINN